MRKLSHAQVRLFRNLVVHGSASYHCKSQSDYGGLTGTIRWACVNGYLSWATYKLTPKGRAKAKELGIRKQ